MTFVKFLTIVCIAFALTAGYVNTVVAADITSSVLDGGTIISNTAAQSLASFAQCNGRDCTTCNVVHIANGLIKWLIGFLFVLFAVILAWAGFGLVTSGGNQGALDTAKEKFSNAIIGILLVLSAWLIVDTLMRGLVGNSDNRGSVATDVDGEGEVSGWLFWSQVQCYTPVTPNDNVAFDIGTFEPSTEKADVSGAVDLGTLPGYSGGRGVLPTVAQEAGFITYENSARLKAYTLDKTKAPYAYPSQCSGTPPQFFKISESGGVRIAGNLTVCDLTNCGSGQRAGEYAYLDPRAVAGVSRVAAVMGSAFSVNSGYRSPSYNAGIDGAGCSQHMNGKAFDIAATGSYTPATIERICKEKGAGWTKQYNTFTHCDWR